MIRINTGYNRQKTTIDTTQPKKTKANPVVNPEVNENRLNVRSKPTSTIGNRQFKFQTNAPKRQISQSTGIDRFKVPSQEVQPSITIAPKKVISKPAPSSQFKKYLNDAENVFYEDSPNVKTLRRIKTAKFYLTIFVLLMVLCYIAVGRIVPFPKERCPKHAVCNVFIHCHKGYALQGEICIIDPQIINKAKQISQAVVTQLKYNYGERDCFNEEQTLPISTKIQDVFSDFKVEDDILMNEIIYFFVNKTNQVNHQFSYKFNNIVAASKLHSLSCSTTLFIRSSNFKYYLLVAILMGFGGVKLIKVYIESRKIQGIYQFLKRKTFIQGELCINEVKQEAERIFGAWTSERWIKVDKVRSSDGCIAYYIDEQQVIWRKID